MTEYAWIRQFPFEEVGAAFTKAVGGLLREARATGKLTRIEAVRELGRPVADRTLLTYENGTRILDILRLLDLCVALRTSMPRVVAHALARVHDDLVTNATHPVPDEFGETLHELRLESENWELQRRLGEVDADLDRERVRADRSREIVNGLVERVHRLRTEIAHEKARAERAERRVVEGAEYAESLKGRLASARNDMTVALARTAEGYEKQLRQQREEHRRSLVEVSAGHAAEVDRLLRTHARATRRGTPADEGVTEAGDEVDAVGRIVAGVAVLIRADADMACPLDDNELELVRMAARGLDTEDMAEQLTRRANKRVAVKTVADHQRALYDKLGVRSRGRAVAMCLATGWVDPLDLGFDLFGQDAPRRPDFADHVEATWTRLLPLARLSARDRQVLGRLARGDDNPVIADKLGLDVTAVHNSMKLIIPATGATNRFHAIGILHHIGAIVAANKQPATWVVRTETAPPAESKVRQAGVLLSNLDTLRPPDDADPKAVAKYNMLQPLQKTILKALAMGQDPSDIARALHMPVGVLRREITKACRRFNETSHIGLASVARELFGVRLTVHTTTR